MLSLGTSHRTERPLLIPAPEARGPQRGVALPAQRGLAPDARSGPISQLAGILQRRYPGETHAQ